MTPAMARDNSPHRHADAITSPMLVIHGDHDYRVPVGEALRLWWDLVSRHEGEPEEMPHRFLYYPDENHRSEEHTSELQSLMRISYAVFGLKKKNKKK